MRILCWQNAGSAEKSHENKKDGVRLFLLFMIVFPLQSERNGDAILWQKHNTTISDPANAALRADVAVLSNNTLMIAPADYSIEH